MGSRAWSRLLWTSLVPLPALASEAPRSALADAASQAQRILQTEAAGAARPLLLVALPWLALLLATSLRPSRAWGWVALALGIRLLKAPYVSSLPQPKGWWLEEAATPCCGVDHWTWGTYGDGWTTLLSPLVLLTGDPDIVHLALIAASAATVGALHVAVRRATERPGAADLAALILATLPLHATVAAMLTRFALSVVLATLAVAASLGTRRREGLLAALSIGLLVQTRPTMMLVAIPLLVLLGRRHDRGVLGVATMLWAGRGVQLLFAISDKGTTGALWSQIGQGAELPWVGPGAAWTALDPTLVPMIVPLLALFGLVALDRWARAWSSAVLALTTLPFLHFPYAFDRIRMQLLSIAVLAGLAGVGASWLHARLPRRAAFALALVAALAWWPARSAPGTPWIWWSEENVARRLPTSPQLMPAVVLADPGWDPRQVGWWVRRGVLDLRTFEDPLPQGTLRFVGAADHLQAHQSGRPIPLSGWTAVDTVLVPTRSDHWFDLPESDVRIGWYRLEEGGTTP